MLKSTLPGLFVTAAILLSTSPGTQAQGYDTSKLLEVDAYIVTSFAHSSCTHEFDTLYSIDLVPAFIRSQAIGSVFEFTEFIGFKTYWTPWSAMPGFSHNYFLSEGMCRGFSFSLLAKEPGIYTIIFEHPEKPCVMQIAITERDVHEGRHLVQLRFFQRCHPDALFRHYRSRDMQLNFPKNQPVTIEVGFKEDDCKEPFNPGDEGFSLVKTVQSNTSHSFNYLLPHFGIYRFKYTSPSYPYVQLDYVRLRPDGYDKTGKVALK
ncbi:MAG: hypothetical protein R2830_19385 [Saprospiraceae bacterium]